MEEQSKNLKKNFRRILRKFLRTLLTGGENVEIDEILKEILKEIYGNSTKKRKFPKYFR